MTARYDIAVDQNFSPRVATIDAPSVDITMQDLLDTLRNLEESFGEGMAWEKMVNASGKEPLGGGVAVGITLALQNVLLAFEARKTPAETGTVTTDSVVLATESGQAKYPDLWSTLVGWWDSRTKDNTEDKLFDVGLNGNDGTRVDPDAKGPYTYVDDATEGRVWEGLSIGTRSRRCVLDSSIQNSEFTYVIRFKSIAPYSSNGDLFFGGNDVAANNYGIYVNTSGNIIHQANGSVKTLASGTNFRNGSWHTVGITRDSAGDLQLYYDGVATGAKQNISFAVDVHTLMNYIFTGIAFEPYGRLSWQAAYSSALTATQMSDLHNVADYRPWELSDAFTTRTFKDSAADFVTAGVERGSLVINFTDKSVADVVEVVGPTELRITKPVNGFDNEMDLGDEYQVFNITQCNVEGGNLTAVDDVGGDLDPILPTAFTQVVRTASSSATLSEQADIQYSSFNGGVTVDTSSSYSGTSYPVGTPRQPVNNMADALTIASARGLTTFYVLGDLTLNSAINLTGYVFIGESKEKTEVTIDADATVTACEFYECTVTGTLDGDVKLRQCCVQSVNYISGYIEECVLEGPVTLGGGASAYFLDCWGGEQRANPPEIDMGGSGQALVLQNYNGMIELKNKTGADEVNITLNAGEITVAATVTDGSIHIDGTGVVNDNSTGSAVVDDSQLVNPQSVATAVWSDATGVALVANVVRALGLAQENYHMDQTSYTAVGGQQVLTSARLRIYDSAVNVGTDTGVVATYTVTPTWNGDGTMATYGVAKQ